jgi:hypothetical protein
MKLVLKLKINEIWKKLFFKQGKNQRKFKTNKNFIEIKS